MLVLSWDGSAKGQDYLLAVFGVQGENKLLLIFAVKCLSCLQTDCGQRIICFNMYPHSSYLFFSMSKAESFFDAAFFLTVSTQTHSVYERLKVILKDPECRTWGWMNVAGVKSYTLHYTQRLCASLLRLVLITEFEFEMLK